ncbi:aspartate/glutamate racemase family protein [Tenuibacillus multivorans]|uniref:Aspartate racemase n=1 Tax=Tenuibacillus multivorans TaxID=237069 RepID=A0A1H0B160_9BACI|nr:aspartate/glutamate racemase family protein [Tenuibacillus multivorans]GEL77572.1 aspartate racemase [Tenuibacillus multivorans]SDN39422.1 aspartate racemase [Tenuibacillus multivorans]
MKTIGIIGGMSWESSATYYRLINEKVNEQLGGLHSAKCILYSVDFYDIERWQSEGDWWKAGDSLWYAARSLELAGADFIILATNTMHKVVEIIEQRITIPVLHIADAAANEIERQNIKKVGLLGTKYTMEQDFYKDRVESHNMEVIVPEEPEHERVNDIIFSELVLGEINSESKNYYLSVIQQLIDQGAEGIILGCTEIGLLIKQDDVSVPIFDTTEIHVQSAVEKSLEEE